MSYIEILTEKPKIFVPDAGIFDKEQYNHFWQIGIDSLKELQEQDPNMAKLLEGVLSIDLKEYIQKFDSDYNSSGSDVVNDGYTIEGVNNKRSEIIFFMAGVGHIYKGLSAGAKEYVADLPKLDDTTLTKIKDGQVIKELKDYFSFKIKTTPNLNLLVEKIDNEYPDFSEFQEFIYHLGYAINREYMYGAYLVFAVLKSLNIPDEKSSNITHDVYEDAKSVIENESSNIVSVEEDVISNVINKLQTIYGICITEDIERYVSSRCRGDLSELGGKIDDIAHIVSIGIKENNFRKNRSVIKIYQKYN